MNAKRQDPISDFTSAFTSAFAAKFDQPAGPFGMPLRKWVLLFGGLYVLAYGLEKGWFGTWEI